MNEIRQAVWSVNRDVPIAIEQTMEVLYAGSLARTSFMLVMLGIAGSMALVLVGAAVGLVAAAALGRLMSSLLFGIGPMDPAAHVVAFAVVIGAAAAASYLPARRAANIDPMETLKTE